MSRNAERRLQRLLQKQKLLFIRVGAFAHDDRVISTCIEVDGAMRSSREYNTLIRDIVACVLGETPRRKVPDEK